MQIVHTGPAASGCVSFVRLQAGQPVEHRQVQIAKPARVRQYVSEGPVAVGSLLADVLARYGLFDSAMQQALAARSDGERLDAVA